MNDKARSSSFLGEVMFNCTVLVKSLVLFCAISSFTFVHANNNQFDFTLSHQATSLAETKLVKLSPNQRYLYAAGEHLTVYDRQLNVIQELGSLEGSALDLMISPSGSFLYLVGQEGVWIYQRNIDNGKLNLTQTLLNNGIETDGFTDAKQIEVSQDGASLYLPSYNGQSLQVLSKGGVGVFETDSALTSPEWSSFTGAAMSPDGQFLYISQDTSPSNIYTFAIDTAAGNIKLRHTLSNDKYSQLQNIEISETGSQLVATSTSSGAIYIFDRDEETGALIQNTVIDDFVATAQGDDDSALSIASAELFNRTSVAITFNQQVEQDTAEDISNYQLNRRGKILSATLQADSETVVLLTSRLGINRDYLLSVSHLAMNSEVKLRLDKNQSSFQQGTNGYTGMKDTWVGNGMPGVPMGAIDASLRLDRKDDFVGNTAALLQWDLSEIPDSAIITGARVDLFVFNPTVARVRVWESNIAWSDKTANWKNIKPYKNQGARVGAFSPSSSGWQTVSLNKAGRTMVQDWVRDNKPNNGLMLRSIKSTDGLEVYSSIHYEPVIRPKLLVTYLTSSVEVLETEHITLPSGVPTQAEFNHDASKIYVLGDDFVSVFVKTATNDLYQYNNSIVNGAANVELQNLRDLEISSNNRDIYLSAQQPSRVIHLVHLDIAVATDSDNDGIEDLLDAFPNDPNEWSDLDGDGIGSVADLDNDDDGMSDLDEIALGRDPNLKSDGTVIPSIPGAPVLTLEETHVNGEYSISFNAAADVDETLDYRLFEKVGTAEWQWIKTLSKAAGDQPPYSYAVTDKPTGEYHYRGHICLAQQCSANSDVVSVNVIVDSSVPSNLPRLDASSITKMNLADLDVGDSFLNGQIMGAFKVGGDYTQGRIAFNPDGNNGQGSLFVSGHAHHFSIQEVAVPITLKSISELKSDPFNSSHYAKTLQPAVRFLNKLDESSGWRWPGAEPNDFTYQSLQYYKGKLFAHAAIYYDGNGTDKETTFRVENPSDLAGSHVVSGLKLQGAQHLTTWTSPVPESWKPVLKTDYVMGSGLGLAIMKRLSAGPSLFTVDYQDLLTAKSGDAISTVAHLDYFENNTLNRDYLNYGGVSGGVNNDLHTMQSAVGYGFIVPGTRTYAVLGSSAGHTASSQVPDYIVGSITDTANKNGTIFYKLHADPRFVNENGGISNGYDTYHQWDKGAYYWLYDMNEILASGETYEPRPYDYGYFRNFFSPVGKSNQVGQDGAYGPSGVSNPIKNGTWDEENKHLYLSLPEVQKHSDGYSSETTIVVIDYSGK